MRQGRLALLAEQMQIDAPFLEGIGSGLAHVGVMFKDGEPILLAAAAHDYACHHAAVLEAGIDHFEVGGARGGQTELRS